MHARGIVPCTAVLISSISAQRGGATPEVRRTVQGTEAVLGDHSARSVWSSKAAHAGEGPLARLDRAYGH